MADLFVDLLAMARSERILRAQAIDQWQEALDERSEMELSAQEGTIAPDELLPEEQPQSIGDDLQPNTARCRYCDNPAPTRGRFAGRCADHRHLPAFPGQVAEAKPDKPKVEVKKRPARRRKKKEAPAETALMIAARDVAHATVARDMWQEKLDEALGRVRAEMERLQ